MPRSRPVDGFSLEYDRAGSGPAVVLLHGWPGSRDDQRDVADRLAGEADVVVPDLRGFGGSDRHARDPAEAYSADAQADSVCARVNLVCASASVTLAPSKSALAFVTLARA